MKVSLLIHNLSGNNLVRSVPIASVLSRFVEVEALGFVGPSGVFGPYREAFSWKAVPWPHPDGPRAAIRELRCQIEGDVLYAFKPNELSLGVGLAERRDSGRPLVLDAEDFDLAFQFQRGPVGLCRSLLRPWDPHALLSLWRNDRRAKTADAVTVVSTFLQRRHGGVLLPHAADTTIFDPARIDRPEARSRWGTAGHRTILFAGKVSEHKGLAELTDLLERLRDPAGQPVQLLLVGGAPSDPLLVRLVAAGRGRVRHVPSQPHDKMPEILAAADLVVLPQRRTLYTRAQIPGKIYEAMAMGLPVVATAVSDLPEMLEGAGLVVPAGDPDALLGATQRLIDDPGLAGRLGAAARVRAVESYSHETMERILRGVFARFGAAATSGR